MTPGTHPMRVSRNTINTDPQPRSITAKGGKIIANSTCKQLISLICLIFAHKLCAKVLLFSNICKQNNILCAFRGIIAPLLCQMCRQKYCFKKTLQVRSNKKCKKSSFFLFIVQNHRIKVLDCIADGTALRCGRGGSRHSQSPRGFIPRGLFVYMPDNFLFFFLHISFFCCTFAVAKLQQEKNYILLI